MDNGNRYDPAPEIDLQVRVKDKETFDQAANGKETNGTISRYIRNRRIESGIKILYVYIELGRQIPLPQNQRGKRNNTEKKLFKSCYIEIFETHKDMLEQENIQHCYEDCEILLEY
jgi:hypothetical protein